MMILKSKYETSLCILEVVNVVLKYVNNLGRVSIVKRSIRRHVRVHAD